MMSYLIRWAEVSCHTSLGGLRIHTVEEWNVTTLGKWLWRFLRNPISFRQEQWKVKQAYMLIGGTPAMILEHPCAAHGGQSKALLLVSSLMQVEIGNGCKTRFCHDLLGWKQTAQGVPPQFCFVDFRKGSACYTYRAFAELESSRTETSQS